MDIFQMMEINKNDGEQKERQEINKHSQENVVLEELSSLSFQNLPDPAIECIFKHLVRGRLFTELKVLGLFNYRAEELLEKKKIWRVDGRINLNKYERLERIKKFSDSVPSIEEVDVYYPKTGDLLYLVKNHPEIKTLRVYDVEIELEEMERILSLPSLVDLELYGCDLDTSIPLHLVTSIQLRKLRTPRCSLNLRNAAEVIKKQDCLVELDLESTYATNHTVSQISYGIYQLKYLNLSQNSEVSNRGIEDLSRSRFSFSLRTLNLSATNITLESLKLILSGFSSLENLDVSRNPRQRESRLELNQKNTALRSLNISGCSLISEDVQDILQSCPNLKVLNLSNNRNIVDNSFQIFNQRFANMEALNLNGVDISDKLFSSFLFLLFPNLTELNLDNTKITDEGLETITRKVPKLKRLSVVSLCITDKGLQVLSACTYLERIECRRLMSSETKTLLREHCSPNLEISFG
ncbi:uncharacterized protein LOC111697944 [Eurytemora carolleeae]|uniref:uncharacterized protein LOC111697944 n=1 Tax=Eurytemora carolleeae TaxID=1294199 RepID=UPI000C78C5B3|nr:uncharacterized protein LOC111697944 [Eurytemora carolleeae]|eukprot:XP_023323885.1 uncharacterized protein LOC111697944 [Eurytemora affinis]